MTHQETFDIVLAHLRQQDCASIGENGQPAYHGVEGCKDPVGCLIPDEFYDPRMEGATCLDWWDGMGPVTWTSKIHNKLKELGHDPGFVRELQRAHDMTVYMDEICGFMWCFKRKCRHMIKAYGLQLSSADSGQKV